MPGGFSDDDDAVEDDSLLAGDVGTQHYFLSFPT
jgi:hypothetical protein